MSAPDLDGMIVTIDDIRKAGFCVRGTRGWFERHELSFADFLREGLPASQLIARGDSLAETVVRRKIQREHLDG